jgi:hypothetical protein
MMRRRLSALITCFLVLTLSLSGNNVCEEMSHRASAPDTSHATTDADEHHAPAHSHQTSGKSIPSEHCQNAATCAGVVFSANVLLIPIEPLHVDHALQLAAFAPDSESPDLEPPPPKA